MQKRIEELEYIKNNLTSPNQVDLTNRRKSLVLLHDAQRRFSLPRFSTLNKSVSMNTDNHNSVSFDQRSVEETDTDNPTPIASVEKSQPTLDRSRLTIFLPPLTTNKQPMQKTTVNTQDNLMSSAVSIEDVAQIDTELNLTLLLRENQGQTTPLLYSKTVLNRTVKFRSLSSKTNSIKNQNETSTNEEMVISKYFFFCTKFSCRIQNKQNLLCEEDKTDRNIRL